MAETTSQEHGQGDDDRLSTLPDDIILLILDKLDQIRDAARTTVLSKRWRHLQWGLRSEIVLDVVNFDATHQDDDLEYTIDDLARTSASVVEATEIILQQHRRQHTTVQLLDITFYLRDESIGIVRAVDRAMADHTILAAEFSIIPDMPDIYCKDDDVLVAYGRRFMAFFDAYPRAFAGLKSLSLHALRLGESNNANVLSNCKKLEYLSLVNCEAGIGIDDDQASVLQIEHQHLVELVIIFCGFETVELKWLPRLTRVTCKTWPPSQDQYPLSFGYVPQLRVLKLTLGCTDQHKAIKLSEFLGNHAIVGELDLNFQRKKIWIQPEGPKRLTPLLRNLRVVTLRFIHEEYDLMWTLFILEAAPLLHTLNMQMSYHACYSDDEDDYNQTDENTRENFQKEADLLKWETQHGFKHYNMKKLAIKGFQVEAKFTRYIRRVMEAAMNLEVVSLCESHPCLRCEFLPSTIYPRTQKEIDLIKKQISGWRSSPIQIEIV